MKTPETVKTIKVLGLTVFAALALSLNACSGDDDGGGGGSSLDTYITAKVDGENFETSAINGQSFGVASRTGTGESTFISVSCNNADAITATNFESIHIILVGVTAPGTYAINSDTNSTLGYVVSTPSNMSWDTGDCANATGTITVTTLNATKIEGTFSFTGSNDDDCTSQKVVTQGEFRGTFTN